MDFTGERQAGYPANRPTATTTASTTGIIAAQIGATAREITGVSSITERKITPVARAM